MFFRWAELLTYLAASVPLTRAFVMSNTFRFFAAVLRQISSCFSILSSAKFLPQFLQAFKSSLGFGANRDLLAGVLDPAGGAWEEIWLTEIIENQVLTHLLLDCRRRRNWLFGIFDFYFDSVVGVGVTAAVLDWAPRDVGGGSWLHTRPGALSVLLKRGFSARTSAASKPALEKWTISKWFWK